MRMTKLKLKDLAVSSFATGRIPPVGGTVRGYAEQVPGEFASWPEGTCLETCPPAHTEGETCRWTCADFTCHRCPTELDPTCQPGTV